MNDVVAGSSLTTKFTGSAVHGGGSCQFSVTYEYPPPSDPSKWKVIHTIIGGCPASAAGNVATVGSDADGRPNGPQCGNSDGTECVRQFDITIPKELQSGNATFAWTWFNKIGNREMYMNCAPIAISGGASDSTFFDSLPEIFIANIPGQCTTNAGVLDIPNPGSSVETLEAATPGANGNCPAAGSSSGGSSAAPASSKAAATSTGAAGVFAPGAGATTLATSAQSTAPAETAPADTPIESSPAETPVESSPAETAAPTSVAATSAAAAVPTGSTQCGENRVSCSTDGALVCMGASYWGLCDRGCAYKMAVAAGTKCESGTIGFAKRSHVHRRRIHGHS